MRRVILIFLLIIAYPLFTFAGEVSYPTNQVKRPLTLPAGIWELGAGGAYLQWENGSPYTLRPVLSLRYGITDDLEFNLLGLRYRVFNRPPMFELLVNGRIVALGYYSVDGTNVLAEIGIEGKQRINPSFAILYRLEDYYTYFAQTRDKSDIRISLGGLYSFTDRWALELTGTYRRLWGFDDQHARIFTTTIYYNISSAFDILFEGEYGDFSENESLRLYSKSFRKAYGIKLNLRF